MVKICVPGLRPPHFLPSHPPDKGKCFGKKRGGLRQSRLPWRRLGTVVKICVPGLRPPHFLPEHPPLSGWSVDGLRIQKKFD